METTLSSNTATNLRNLLKESVHALVNERVELDDSWLSLLWESYGNPARVYHDVHHVLDVCAAVERSVVSDTQSHAILAALFHDVVYLPLDGELSQRQRDILKGEVPEGVLLQAHPVNNLPLALVQTIFGFSSESSSEPLKGSNEGLSALIAARLFYGMVSLRDMLIIVACIEASIPFRPTAASAATSATAIHCRSVEYYSTRPMMDLYDRCLLANDKFQIGLSAQELKTAVQTAAQFANCDLAAFVACERQVFLQSTWRLLPEWNPAVLQPDLSIWIDTLQLLCRMYKGIAVENIFHSFEGVPDNLATMKQHANDNLAYVGRYAETRLRAAQVLRDLLCEIAQEKKNKDHFLLAELPVGTYALMRQIDTAIRKEGNLTEDHNKPYFPDFSEELYDHLVNGRNQSFSWDAATAPFTAFLYARGVIPGTNKVPAEVKNVVKQCLED